MPCAKELKRYNSALSRQRQLQEELANAPTPRKAALVRRIEAQELRVEAAAADLADCRHRNAPPPPPQSQTAATLVKIRLRSSHPGLQFWEEPEQPLDGLRRTFLFVGTTHRTWTIANVDITRRSTDVLGVEHVTVYHLGQIAGTLDMGSGAMTLRGTLWLDQNPDRVAFELQTGAASSSHNGINFDVTGHPLAGSSVLLVGAGVASIQVATFAWALEIDVLFDTTP